MVNLSPMPVIARTSARCDERTGPTNALKLRPVATVDGCADASALLSSPSGARVPRISSAGPPGEVSMEARAMADPVSGLGAPFTLTLGR